MNTKDQKKRLGQGFNGQKIVEASKTLINSCQTNLLISKLFITRMGFYPKATNHYFNRSHGFNQAIIIYCTDGKGWINMPDNRLTINAGDVFIIPPGTPHSYGTGESDPWSIYWMHLSGGNASEINNIVLGVNNKQPVNTLFSNDRVLLFNKIFDAVFNGHSIPNLLFANMSLHYFLASFIMPENFVADMETEKIETPTEKAVLFMQNNLKEMVSIEDIAKSAGLSVSFFSRKFKIDTGYSPMEYLNHLRIQKACQLLHFTKVRINEVIFQVGFNDPFYFSRVFKKHMGVSPFSYRKSGSY
ncbi:MAG: AraC family transcriptional regulator [Bacteroidota bacterium]